MGAKVGCGRCLCPGWWILPAALGGAIIWGLLILSCIPAHAQSPSSASPAAQAWIRSSRWEPRLPLPEYDHPYNGRLKLMIVDAGTLARICGRSAASCQQGGEHITKTVSAATRNCTVILPRVGTFVAGKFITAQDLNTLYRFEIGNCSGME